MIDETRERLIVMGGTTEPGVFQVELTAHPIHALNGSIFLAAEIAGQRISMTASIACPCKTIWEYTAMGQAEMTRYRGHGPPLGTSIWACCPCIARLID